jgi:hypothetical protein
VVAVEAGLPEVLTACHVPPKLVIPIPFAVPAPESPEKVYSGHPPYVTYRSPVAVRIVVSIDAFIPLPATGWLTPLGNSTGGQIAVHPLASVQVILPPFSELRR